MMVPYLVYVAHVKLCRTANLLRLYRLGDGDYTLLLELQT
jgi:hypothetical protein